MLVTREVYETYYRMKRREKYLEEADRKHDLLFLSQFDTEEGSFVNSVEDKNVNVERIVETGIMIEELNKALAQLTPEERELIEDLYFRELSMRQTVEKWKVYHVAIGKRRDSILK